MDQTDAANKKLKWRFWISFCGVVVFITWMKYYLSPLRSGEIVRYEMAKTANNAASLVEQWTMDGKSSILLKSIYVDYIFIIIYCLAISFASRYLSSLTRNEILVTAGKFFAYFIFAAGIFDVIENVAMTMDLQQGSFVHARLVYKMAISKFSILLMSLFFIATCVMFWLMGSIKRKDKSWQRV